ncbi:phage tail protein [Phytohabitans sp. LJ34]|uniref:phage tail protein n=1 Tax=Phytohabitans sp. LJ34 TaxID=3452217 RepID=UPI003F888F40
MTDIDTRGSGYLRYLPPVLWEGQAGGSLGAVLRVFEKMLTGLPDDHRAGKTGGRVVRPGSIAEAVDRLPHLFDPWRTPERFLPWLASWVGLDLPPSWDEYQRRKAIAQITRVYADRGTAIGLARYLDLYTVGPIRPRIAVDDSAKVLFARLLPDQAAGVSALIRQGPFIRPDRTAAYRGLVTPQCIALSPSGDLLVGDGGMTGTAQPVKPGLWRITRSGGYADMAGAPPAPLPLGQAVPAGQQPFQPGRPVAVAVDARTAAWKVYLFDANGGLHRLTAPDLLATTLQPQPPLHAAAVSMAVSPTGQLLLLDPSGVTVVTGADTGTAPAVQPRRPLATPGPARSLLARADGDLVIGVARTFDPPSPAELVRVDRRSDPWGEHRLLAGLPAAANPLIAPVAIVEEDATRLLVLDLGLWPEPTINEPFRHDFAEHAAVYRVDIGVSPPTVTRVTEPGRLVYPQGMVLHEGTVYLCDPGEPHLTERRTWRAGTHEFGVLVHFAKSREPDVGRIPVQKMIMREIDRIVAEQKPATTLASVLPRPEQVSAPARSTAAPSGAAEHTGAER